MQRRISWVIYPISHFPTDPKIYKNNRKQQQLHSPERNDKCWWSLKLFAYIYLVPKENFSLHFAPRFHVFSAAVIVDFQSKVPCTAKEFKLKKKQKKKTNKFLCLFSSKKRCRLRSSHAGAHRYNSVNRLSLVFIQKVQLPLSSFLIYWGTTTTTTRNNINNNKASSLSIVNHLHDDVTIFFLNPCGQNWRRIRSKKENNPLLDSSRESSMQSTFSRAVNKKKKQL